MARTSTAGSARKKLLKIDFTGVESGGVVPEGEYIAEVTKCSQEESSAGNDYLAWEMKIAEGKHAGKKLFNNTSLQEQSLWATKLFMESLGLEIEDGPMEFDLADMVGLSCGVVIEHETYKGRLKGRVIDTYPLEDEQEEEVTKAAAKSSAKEKGKVEEEEEGEEAPKTTSKSKGKSKSKPDPEEEEESEGDLPTPDEVAEMGKADLRKLNETHDLGVELEGTTAQIRRAINKAIAAKAEEPEEEEEEAPKTTSKSKGKSKSKVSPDDVNAMDEEGLTELVETYELSVELDELPNLRRKKAAVIDALEEAGLLDE